MEILRAFQDIVFVSKIKRERMIWYFKAKMRGAVTRVLFFLNKNKKSMLNLKMLNKWHASALLGHVGLNLTWIDRRTNNGTVVNFRDEKRTFQNSEMKNKLRV